MVRGGRGGERRRRLVEARLGQVPHRCPCSLRTRDDRLLEREIDRCPRLGDRPVERPVCERGTETQHVRRGHGERPRRRGAHARHAEHRLRHRQAVAPPVRRVVGGLGEHRPRGQPGERRAVCRELVGRRPQQWGQQPWREIGHVHARHQRVDERADRTPEPRRVGEGREQVEAVGCGIVHRLVDPADAPLGAAGELTAQLAQQTSRELAVRRHARVQPQEDRRMAGRRQPWHDGVGEQRRQVGRGGVIADPGAVRVDSVEVAGVDRPDQRRRCGHRRPGRHGRRWCHRIAEPLELVDHLADPSHRVVASIGPHHRQQRRAGQQLQRRMQHERIGRFPSWHGDHVRHITHHVHGSDGRTSS